jgi:hypothetical protein
MSLLLVVPLEREARIYEGLLKEKEHNGAGRNFFKSHKMMIIAQ